MSMDETVASPCVGICKLDASTRLCEGCLRTVDEIGGWRDADAEWRRLVLQRIAARRIKKAAGCLIARKSLQTAD